MIRKGKYIFLILLILISCTETLDFNLGKGYILGGYEDFAVLYKKAGPKREDKILLGGIVNYSFDDNFILIYREISERVKVHFNDHPYSEIMKGGDSIQYWIIQKHTDSIFGPLNKSEYLLKRSQLSIPDHIQLKE